MLEWGKRRETARMDIGFPHCGTLGDELRAEMTRRLRSMGIGRERSLAASGLGTLAGKQDSTHFVTYGTCLEVKRALGVLVVGALLEPSPKV